MITYVTICPGGEHDDPCPPLSKSNAPCAKDLQSYTPRNNRLRSISQNHAKVTGIDSTGI